jgi:hypothetical protein
MKLYRVNYTTKDGSRATQRDIFAEDRIIARRLLEKIKRKMNNSTAKGDRMFWHTINEIK